MTAEQKNTAVNSFEGGMNTDIHPMRMDNKTLRYARNIDFVTAGAGEQLILQKRDGNELKLSITHQFEPIAVAEMNSVLYIVSYNPVNSTGEIGSYPSPDYTDGTNKMKDEYSPLMNYHDGTQDYEDDNFNFRFRTKFLNFFRDTFVDIRVQPSYDGSVNLILTDDKNPVRLINTRFAVDETGKYAELIQRRTGDSTNSYSDAFFNHAELIPRTKYVTQLTFGGVIEGGKLYAGGYRYFFRYIDADGAVTDLIEESRLVSIHNGNAPESSYGQESTKTTDKSVKFTLSNLDKAYYGVQVFYTISAGEIDPVTQAYKLVTPFKVLDDGTCNIIHTGYEMVADSNKEELAVTYSPIRNCKTLTVSNDRLLLANTESEYTIEDVMDETSAQLLIEEDTFVVTNSATPGIELDNEGTFNYANADFEYNNLGFWKGETYELGVVYVTDKGTTPVYPIQGLDRLEDSFDAAKYPYPATLKTPSDEVVFGSHGLNARGVYRTASNGTLYTVSGNYVRFTGTKLKVDISPLMAEVTTLPAEYVTSSIVAFEGTSGGWRVAYSEEKRQYYLWGKVSNTFQGQEVGHLRNTAFNPGGLIPLPTRSIKFGIVTILADGRVMDNGVTINEVLGFNYGPPVDVKNIANGFFFVRRKRLKDKIMEGISIPTTAVPRTSKYGIGEEFGYGGNWLGCGTSTAGSPVVLAPSPSLCFPFGSDVISQGDTTAEYFTDLKDSQGAVVVITESVVIFGGDAQYDGMNDDEKLITIKVSWVPNRMDNMLFTGIKVTSAYETEGFPVDNYSETDKTITVKIMYFDFPSMYGVIPDGTRILIRETASESDKQGGGGDFIVRAPIKDYTNLGGWAMYSPDIECAPAYFASQLKNSSMGVAVQTANVDGAIQYLTNPDSLNKLLPYSTQLTGSLTMNYTSAKALNTKVDFIGDGAITAGDKGFTGTVDRSLYIFTRYGLGDGKLTHSVVTRTATGELPVIGSGNRVYDSPFRHDEYITGISKSKKTREYFDQEDQRPGTSIKYGKYIGLKINGAETDLGVTPFGSMNTGVDMGGRKNRNRNFFMSLFDDSQPWSDVSKFGAYCQLFNNVDGVHLEYDNWKQRYEDDTDTEYVAISRRYAFSEFGEGSNKVIDIYGGDCYLGQSWKQVWFPKGIEEAPQASDLTAYKEGRRNLAMLGYGYAIAIPAQSNYNFHLRVPEEGFEGEYKVFGRERSFVPLRPVLECRGNRQFDTAKYNFGYSDQDVSDNKFFKLSETAPFYRSMFPNRIYASDPSRENEFINGFTQFSGLNFRDYNTELGPISRIISLKDLAYVIFTGGIGTVGINERSQISSDTGGVYVDNADVLAQKATVLSSTYGTTHPNSVCVSEEYIYGVDVTKRKIWRTAGAKPELISNSRVQSILGEILDSFNAYINSDPDTASDKWIDIFTTFDAFKSEITFTFVAKSRTNYNDSNSLYRTIVFNESEGIRNWVCETDDHKRFLFSTTDHRLMFAPNIASEGSLFKYDTIANFAGNNIFRGAQYDTEVVFSVTASPEMQKLYETMWIVGDNPLPVSMQYFNKYSNKTLGAPNQQVLKPYTNVAFLEQFVTPMVTLQITANMTLGSDMIYCSQPPSIAPPGRTDTLRVGDYISIKNNTTLEVHNFTIISVDAVVIKVNKAATVTMTGDLIFGYQQHLRLTDSAIEDGYGKVVCQVTNDVNNYDRKLRGKWMLAGMTYEGQDQIYINTVVSTYTRSFS